ncbi:sodium:proton antiporter, partial [Francisella tularensis subsp. holarctica]|nr:sodium:proton antiporter [Francisella tularensis subsp. holarctica]
LGIELTSLPFNHGAFRVGSAGIFIVKFARLVSISIPFTVIDKKLTRASAIDNLLVAWSGVRGCISLSLALSLPDEGNVIVSIT